MKSLALAAAFAMIFGVSTANAADGVPSDAAMAAMGLSNVQLMSDAEGLDVRGMGKVYFIGYQYTKAYDRDGSDYAKDSRGILYAGKANHRFDADQDANAKVGHYGSYAWGSTSLHVH